MQRIDTKHKKRVILNFIKRHEIGIIATLNTNNLPEAAVVEYGETNDLELIFDTFTSSRKYRNLLQNPRVALVIGWDDNITIQYEGETVELKGEELERCKGSYFRKNPRAKKWENREGITYFKVTPHWIRYSDLNKDPWKIFELRP